jgi:arylsulfatase A-like enzyme
MCHWYFKPITGIGRGFDVFDISAQPPGGIDATSDTSSSADRLTDAAIRQLSKPENTSKRFYGWVHYFDPHAEYMHHKGIQTFGTRQRDLYDHEVLWTDTQIGRLLRFVEGQPWGKRTAIIVTADHGEAFGEHKLYRHGFEVWEELVRVPLIVHVPGIAPKRVKERRSAIDIVPTILDLMGVRLDHPKGPFDFISGQSLLPDVLARPGAKHEERDVLVDMPAGPNNGARRAFYHGDYKLIVAGGVRFQLFDLKNDPGERHDLSGDANLLKDMKERYEKMCATLREVPIKRPRR